MVDQRLTTIDGTGDLYSAPGAISRSAPSALVIWEHILTESSTQEKGYSKEGELRAFRRTAILIRNAI